MYRLSSLVAAALLVCASHNSLRAQCALACNGGVQVSLSQNGTALIYPQTILTNAYPLSCSPTGPNAFVVSVMGPNGLPIPTSPTVTCANVGQTLTVKVTHTASGNSCWGSISVEDKLPPSIACVDKIVSCAVADLSPNNPAIGYPTVTDNCSANVVLNHSSVFTDLNCNTPYNGIYYSGYVTRIWTATDASGNFATCTQKIFLERKTVWQVIWPKNLDGNTLPALQCSPPPNTTPASTGWPTIDGIPLQNGSNCELNVAFTDQIVPVCDGTYKILRTWTVIDWCNSMTKTHLQIIKVVDDKPPVFTCPADFTASAEGATCAAAVIFPSITATDNCSGFSIKVITPYGTINGNGGSLNGIPVGLHTIKYEATDNCGNVATCTLKLTVTDGAPPVAICDGYTVTSLGGSGSVVLPAQVLDDGSYDNCCPKPSLIFKVKKMGDNGPFTPTITFTCADVGLTTVILRVCDCNGNYNDCMITVEVQEKIDPVITCPPPKNILCKDYTPGGNFNQLYGSPTATDNCGTVTITEFPPIINIGMCGTGTILRTFKATDGGGRTATCSQLITVSNSTLYNGSQISWPPDYSITACTTPDSLDKDKLPAPYNKPILGTYFSGCTQLATSCHDEVFQVSPPACWKILRKWSVIDWCQYNPNNPNSPGRWEHVQVLLIMDNTPPVFVNPPVDITVGVGADCKATVTLVPPVATDCSTQISYTSTSSLGNGFGPFTNVLPGIFTVTYRAFDGCGNQAAHTFKVTVKDTKPPTPVCLNGLSVNLMNNGMVVIWASDFNAGSSNDNCTPQNLLKYSFSFDTQITSDTFTCADEGTNVVNMWVTDQAGNSSYCTTYIIVQDNLGVCPDLVQQTAQVAGLVKTEAADIVEDVKVELLGASAIPIITGSDGSFAFPGLPVNGQYTLKPDKDQNPLNGVTTFDMVTLSKHVLGIQKLNSPYKIIAADINKNNTVTTFDIVELRKVILGVYADFPTNNSWRFVDASFVFPDPTAPFSTPFPEIKTINGLPQAGMNGNFVGLKIGDLNGDAVANNAMQVDDRTAGSLDFSMPEMEFAAGQKLEIPCTARDLADAQGFQFTLGFDPSVVEFLGMKNGSLAELSEANFNFNRAADGLLSASWVNAAETTYPADNQLFTLIFITKQTGKTSEIFNLPLGFTAPEAYRQNERLDLNLTFEKADGQFISAQPKALELRQNQPNPFGDETAIGYILPTESEATMKIFDVSGRLARAYILPPQAGFNELKISRADLPSAGVYQFRLETAGSVLTKKMILID